MSQLDARHGRGYPSVGSLNRLPAMTAPDERDGTISLGQNHMLLPVRSAAPAAVGKADAVRVLLFDGDPIHREALTNELSKQGFVIRSFGDSGALLCALRDAVDVDVIVVLLKGSSLDLLIKFQGLGVTVPVVFLGAGALPAQAVSKLQGVEMLTRRLRGVALENMVESFGPLDQAPHDGPMICGRLLLRSDDRRAFWNGLDVGASFREYNLIHMLVSDVGQYKSYRAIYDRLHYVGFIAGSGSDGYRANVRSVIKRIRNKFRALDPAFDEIESYTGFGYCWKKSD
jgi:two-component system, OmpR family, response regulator ChvI